jgi:hypothetical protein
MCPDSGLANEVLHLLMPTFIGPLDAALAEVPAQIMREDGQNLHVVVEDHVRKTSVRFRHSWAITSARA